MPKLISATLVLSLLLAIPAIGPAQSRTIPERLRQAGTDLWSGASVPSGTSPDFDVVLRDTEVIVRGIVGTPRSYLSDDQMRIFSDYPIIKPAIFFDTEVASSVKPGFREIVVTLEGGKVTIGGLTFTVTPGALPGLEPGTECLLLLKRVKNKFYIAGDGFLGAFAISGGRMNPLTRVTDFAPMYRDAAASAAINSIVGRRHVVAR